MANTSISNLTAGGAVAGTDLFPDVQTVGVGPVKVTATQIKTFIVGAGSVSVASGKTLTVNNTLTLSGTDGTTMTFPSTSATLAGLGIANVFTQPQTFQPSIDGQAGTFRRLNGTQTSNILEIQTEANAFLAGFDKSGLLTLGAASTQTGILKLAGTTSGTVSLSVADAAGTWTMKLPNSGGTNGFILTTDGSGNTSWTNPTALGIDLDVGSTAITNGTTGRLLYDNAGTLGEALLTYSAATLQLGAADVASGAVAQTLQVQSNTGAATTGPNFTIKGSSGTTAGGSIIFQTAATNSYATAFFIDKNGNLEGGSGPSWSINYATNSRLGLHNAYALCWGVGAAGVSSNMSVGLRSEDTTCLGLFSPDYSYNMSFRIYNNSGSKVNFQRLTLSAGVTANMAVVAADNGGTGVAMGLQFGAALTTGGGVTSIFNINTSGHTVWNTDNTYDIGTSAGNRPRTIYAATSVVALGSADGITSQNDFPMLSCIRPSQTARFTTTFGNSNKYSFRVSRGNSNGGGNFVGATDGDATACVFQGWVGATTVTAVPMLFRSYKWDGSSSTAALAATEPVMSFQNGTTTILQLRGDGLVQFAGTNSGFPALKPSSTTLQVRLADDSAFAPLSCGNTTASGTALDVSGTGAASIFNVVNTTTGTLLSVVNSSSATLFSVADTPAITLIDAMTIAVGTTTGTKIGTSTSQKIGFFNATPVVQQAVTADLLDSIQALGFVASGAGDTPLNLSGGALTCGAITTAGNMLFTDNSYDIGAAAATRPRTIYASGGVSHAAPSTKTTDYSQGANDYSLIFNGGATITLTLLSAASYPGKILYVKTIAAQTVVSASSNVKPIDTDTAGTAILAATAGKWAMLQSDGTNWVIMAQG